MAITEQQKYLFSRVPNWYSIKPKESPLPTEIKRAKRVIKNYENKQDNKNKQFRDKFDADVKGVHELIYYQPAKALAAIKAMEKKYKKV